MSRVLRFGIALVVAGTAMTACAQSAAPQQSADAGASGTPQASTAANAAAECTGLPADNVWRANVSQLPVDGSSEAYVASIGAQTGLHPDFGAGLEAGAPIGIPVTTVQPDQAKVPVTFEVADESDPGPYPIPADAAIEGGADSDGDRHVLVIDPAACKLYELFDAHPDGAGWRAGSGAVFDLRSNELRPAGWTSADAAGLPIWPGLVRYSEVQGGTINHAIRITVPRSRDDYVWPARHEASDSSDPALPPMGLRLRLKDSVDISGLPEQARVIAQAMKTYGVIVADNGSAWFVSGEPDDRWSNDDLRTLKQLQGSDFEAVDSSGLQVAPDSGQVR